MARKPQCLFLRSIPSPRGKWCIVFLGASFLVVSLILALNVDVISLAIPLHEWKIYRIGCIFSSSQTTAHSPEAPQYISHAFHPLVGTGNLMFIYASLWGIAKKNGLTPTIPFTKLHDAFHLDLSPEQFFDLSDCDNYVFGMDECCLYDERTEQIFQRAVGRNVSLWGYFQSSRYFHPEHETDIRRQFAFKENIDVRANDIIKGFRLRSGDSMQKRPSVGIHIRRGDVLVKSFWRNFGFTVATREYFRHAMEYLKNKGVIDPIFLVCTNDVEWSRQNLAGFDVHFVENQTSHVDMAILTHMNHLILSAGTFSFFAGYLSSAQHIIYYKGWPRPGSKYAGMMDLSSFWLPEWIAME